MLNRHADVAIVGFASGVASNNSDAALAPWYLYYHPELFHQLSCGVFWYPMITCASAQSGLDALPILQSALTELSNTILSIVEKQVPFCVLAGDHSSAIATWSAVAAAHQAKGDIGLIWIDAHMDSHTPETSHTKNIHGMPLAYLLGHGLDGLKLSPGHSPAIKPQNVCLIGVRSYEKEEALLLKRLGVKIFLMDDIKQKGLLETINEAKEYVSRFTNGFGLSIDIDAVDPQDAPGVSVPEPDGIIGKDLVNALHSIMGKEDNLLGIEIAEFNPLNDQKQMTAKLVVKLIEAVYC